MFSRGLGNDKGAPFWQERHFRGSAAATRQAASLVAMNRSATTATAAKCEAPRGGRRSRQPRPPLEPPIVRGCSRLACRKGWPRRRSQSERGLLIEAIRCFREPSSGRACPPTALRKPPRPPAKRGGTRWRAVVSDSTTDRKTVKGGSQIAIPFSWWTLREVSDGWIGGLCGRVCGVTGGLCGRFFAGSWVVERRLATAFLGYWLI